jgi:hypothetical protein
MLAIAVRFAAAWLARIIIVEDILSRSCCMARRQNCAHDIERRREVSADDVRTRIFVVLQVRLRGILSIGSGCLVNGVLTRRRT